MSPRPAFLCAACWEWEQPADEREHLPADLKSLIFTCERLTPLIKARFIKYIPLYLITLFLLPLLRSNHLHSVHVSASDPSVSESVVNAKLMRQHIQSFVSQIKHFSVLRVRSFLNSLTLFAGSDAGFDLSFKLKTVTRCRTGSAGRLSPVHDCSWLICVYILKVCLPHLDRRHNYSSGWTTKSWTMCVDEGL